MRANIKNSVLLVNADDSCRSAIDFGPAENVLIEEVPHPWVSSGRELSPSGQDLPKWFVLADTGLGRPCYWWETNPDIDLSPQ